MAVEGDPEVSCPAAHLYGDDAPPSAKASVGEIEGGFFHAFFCIDPVFVFLYPFNTVFCPVDDGIKNLAAQLY